MTWQEQAASYLTLHEGSVNHFYLDAVGLVTIGVGHLVATLTDASRLPLQDEFGTLVNSQDCMDEWTTIHGLEPNHMASYYAPHCNLRLTDSDVTRILANDISLLSVSLKKRFPQIETFPNSVQIGCMAMIFALGPGGLFRGYPKFCAAVDAKDWVTASSECGLHGMGKEEQGDLEALFKATGTNFDGPRIQT